MKKDPTKIDKRTFHCNECNYNVQVYGERYFDYGCHNYMDTFVCLVCKRLFEGLSSKLQDFETIPAYIELRKIFKDFDIKIDKSNYNHFSFDETETFLEHIDIKSIQCLFCGNYRTKKWYLSIGQCPKCENTMTFKAEGEISIKHSNTKGLLTINKLDENNKLLPITHKEDSTRIGEPMTDEELHAFAVELVLVYYHYNKGYIKNTNINPGIQYPHIIMANEDTNKLYYVTVKAAIYPYIPEPLPTEHYSTLIQLAEEANAIPVFIGVTFTNYSADDHSPPKCGSEYIVKITRLKEL